MLKTQNYELNKPEYNNVADIFPAVDDNMDIIDRILFDKLDKKDVPRNVVYCGLTTGNAVTYTAKANPTLTAYTDGVIYIIIPHITCSNNPTLNIDGKGVTYLKNSDGNNLTDGDMKANIPYQFVRVGSSFFMCSNKKTDAFGKKHTKNPWKYFGVDMPTPRASFGCIQSKGKAYCIGGIVAHRVYDSDSHSWPTQATVFDKLEIYDVENNTWSQGAPLPRKAYEVMVCVDDVNDKIYVFGGKGALDLWQNDSVSTEIDVYDIRTNTWSILDIKLPYPIADACCEYNDGKIYIFGGHKTESVSNICINANLILDVATGIFTNSKLAPITRTKACSAIVNGKIYILGGVDSAGYIVKIIEVYDIATDNWIQVNSTTNNHVNSCCEAYNGNIYIFGGIGTSMNPFLNTSIEYIDSGAINKTAEIYNITSNSVKTLHAPPTPRDRAKSCIYQDKILFIGGITVRNSELLEELTYMGTVEILDCNYDKN